MHFPVLPGSDYIKKKAAWKREKNELYHFALLEVFKYFKAVEVAGGITTYSAAHGKKIKFMPMIVMFMQDIPEGQVFICQLH